MAGVNLSGADMVRANLVGANLERAQMVFTSLGGADMAGVVLADADLSGAAPGPRKLAKREPARRQPARRSAGGLGPAQRGSGASEPEARDATRREFAVRASVRCGSARHSGRDAGADQQRHPGRENTVSARAYAELTRTLRGASADLPLTDPLDRGQRAARRREHGRRQPHRGFEWPHTVLAHGSRQISTSGSSE